MSDTKYSVKSGFYDAINHDRLYSADDMNQPYKEIMTEGIDADGFAVTPQSTPDMTINVAAGHAFLGGKWVDSIATTMDVPANTALYGRIDSVILRVDVNSEVREANLIYRTGTPADTPEAPGLIGTTGIYEVRLANIAVAVSATAIAAAQITDKRGGSDCPYADIKLGQLVREQQITDDVTSWLAAHVDPVGSAVVVDNTLSIEGAAADAKATGDAIADLNNDLTQKPTIFKNLYDNTDPDIENNCYYTSANTKVVNYSFTESGYIPVEVGKKYRASVWKTTPVNIEIVFFDSNKEYVSGEYRLANGYVTIPNNVAYIRIPVSKTLLSSYVFSEGTDIPPSNLAYNNSGIKIDDVVFENGSVKSKISKQIDFIENLYNPDDEEIETGGYYAYNGNWISDGNFMETGFIPVEVGESYRSSVWTGSIQTNVVFYDENKNYISGLYLLPNGYVVVPPTVAYMRTVLSVSNRYDYSLIKGESIPPNSLKYGVKNIIIGNIIINGEDVYINGEKVRENIDNIWEAIGESPEYLGSQWNGKQWYCYGTSISNINAEGKYPTYLAEMSGMNLVCKGISGGGIGNLGAYSQGQVYSAICNTTDGKLNADIITLETGANDVNADVPLGTIYDTGQSTLAGCLNDCLRYLQKNTNAQIAVTVSPASKTLPSASTKYYEWANMVEQICHLNRVHFLNGDNNMGYEKISDSTKGSMYVVDNIHQTNLGGYIMAQNLWYQLRNIPLFYTAIPS